MALHRRGNLGERAREFLKGTSVFLHLKSIWVSDEGSTEGSRWFTREFQGGQGGSTAGPDINGGKTALRRGILADLIDT